MHCKQKLTNKINMSIKDWTERAISTLYSAKYSAPLLPSPNLDTSLYEKKKRNLYKVHSKVTELLFFV